MRTAGLVITTMLGFACLLSAQEPNRFDFGISVAGVFSKTSSSNDGSVTDTPTTSLEYIGSVRYHLAPKHAVEASVGHTTNSQIFSVSPNSFRVISSIMEFSGAYVFSPYARKKLQTFVFAGGGALRFSPGNTYIDTFPASFGAAAQTSLTFLYGGGADYHLWRKLALRLEYRGLIYRVPDFNVPGFLFTGAKGHLAEPTVGIVVKF
jgi:outer membrane immunogenic protein